MSTRTFTVTVRDSANNAPVVGALVTVYYYDEFGVPRVQASGYTNNQGQFSFTVTIPPEYTMTVEKSGYYTATQSIHQNTPSNITITLQRTGQPITQTITVKVVNQSTNNPIAGAQVVVRQGQTTVAQGTTNASGEVQFTLNEGATYTIEASANGFHSSSTSVTIPLSNPLVTISLAPLTQTITVRVVDTGNQAIANATVVVRQGQTTIAQTTTNASGEAQFNLPYGSYTIQASATHYHSNSTSVTIPLSNPVVTISLTPQTQTITVRVVNQSNNNPISGAQVVVRQGQTTVTQGTTNASGEVQFTLSHGTYTIQASATGFQANSTVTISLTPLPPQTIVVNPIVTISLTPLPPQTIVVKVVDRNNQAVPNALVVIRQGQTTIIQTTTNAFGEVQVDLPHGSYSLEVSATHFQTASMNITVPVPNNLVTVTLQRLTQTITFVLINNANNAPISNIVVSVSLNNVPVGSGTTDQQGRTSITLEHGFTYSISVSWGEGRTETISIPSSTTSFTYRITPQFRFNIRDQAGANMSGITVVIENLSTGTSRTITNSSSPVVVSISSSGRHRVTVRREGWKPVVREYEYSSTDQRGLVEDTITMSPTSLTIVARDARGNPVRGALVRVIRDGNVIRQGTTA